MRKARAVSSKEPRVAPRWLKEVLAWILFFVCVSIPSGLLFAFAHDVARMSEKGTRDAQLAERAAKAADLRREVELGLWREREVLRSLRANATLDEIEAALSSADSVFADPFILRHDGTLVYPRSSVPRANIVRALLVDDVTQMPLPTMFATGALGSDTPRIVRPGGSVILNLRRLSSDVEVGYLMHEASVTAGARRFLPSNLDLVRRDPSYSGMLSIATIAQFHVKDPPLVVSTTGSSRPSMLVWQKTGTHGPWKGPAGLLPPSPPTVEAPADSAANVILAQTFVMNVAPKDPIAAEQRALRSGQLVWWFTSVAVLLLVVMALMFFVRSRRALRLAELRTDFVASVSHELRTPLASIQMLSELLEASAVTEDERPEIERTLAGEARRLTATLNRMLRFGALERGKLTAERKATNIKDVVDDASARLRRLHPDKSVTVAADENLIADIDPMLVGLAVENLLLNAAKYAPEGGPYDVSVQADGADVLINVADHGPGLDPRAKRKIFLPFERADDRLARATEGTGVGLALVRGIARAHGGDATVESAVGEGATFTLKLANANVTTKATFGNEDRK